MSDATRHCPVCGADNPSRARFCGSCGTAIAGAGAGRAAAPPAAGTRSIMPWFIAGVCVLAVHAAVIVLAVRRPQPAAANQADMTNSGAAPFAGGPTGRAPDISNMTPREAADRLYDRIARASEAGDSGQVSFFGPMALQAYARVTPRDPDARLHIGLIELALGNTAGATAQADSIGREAGDHLFGPMLRARAAEAAGNSAAARQAYRQLVASYDRERAKNLPEYDQHNAMLTETLAAARRSGS